MPFGLSGRLLSVLQLTRMALVFTAISNSLCALLLWAEWRSRAAGGELAEFLEPGRVLAVIVVSVGLYGYGMSLNDIIDRRRDRQIAAHRPLPSGRIGLIAAHIICVVLGLAALAAGAYLAEQRPIGPLALVLLVWTGLLITFYDFAGKYLVAPGLLLLGMIRFFHATIPAPQLPLLWHPLLLLNHVAILSTVAYVWEQKRPALTRLHWWAVLGGLGLVDVLCIGLVWWRREPRLGGGFARSLWVTPWLALPAAAVIAFVGIAAWIWLRRGNTRLAGQNLMLAGLLWLIVYDAAFAAAYVSARAAAVLLLLLPIAYLSVQLMRWWSRLMLLSQRPEYQRAR